ncbi:MAG: DUF4838 domain-containing protein [Verrucomicrobiae bacterium]|nr:DUF4838 domain-containing protein [Verrucomicrobiae bacterium]
MRRIVFVVILVLTATFSTPRTPAAERVLAEKGCGAYIIRVCADATPAERHAAEELQRFLKQITGVELPLQNAGPLPARALLVGRDAEVERLASGVDWAKLGGEGFVVRTCGPHLALAGGRPRGTLYAVYSFLDQELGCRWFAPDCSRIPKRARLAVRDLNRVVVPRLEYRETFSWSGYDGDWAARNFSNGHSMRLTEKHGDKVVYQGFVHTFYPLLPPEKHFAQHPEWYSERNGKRFHEHGQLCLTNPEVVREVTAAVRAWLRKNPKATIVSVSQNDWHGWCECAKCKAVDDEEGSHSGTLLRFVNQVAEAIEKEFPQVAVDTLAYQYTRKPPRHVRPRPNVIVRLCSIECCFSHPLEECPQNKAFVDDIVGWSKICRRLYIWDYVTNFAHYLLPHPNLDVLEANIRFFIAHGVRGIFEQGEYQTPGGEMLELRSYIIARLLWNPDYGAKRALEEFLDGYYGPAAPPIRKYIRLLHDKVKKDNIHIRCFVQPTAACFTPEIIAQAEKLFTEAERLAAKQPEILKRVRVAHMPVQYVMLQRGRAWTREALRAGKKTGPFGAHWSEKEVAEKFLAAAAEAGVKRISEGAEFAPFKEKLLLRLAARREKPAPPPGTEKLPTSRVLDAQDDEFSFHKEGTLCGIRADETASDGACAWLTGATHEWAVQFYPPPDYFKAGRRYHARAVVKVRKVKDTGDAFSFGIYDTEAKKGLAHRRVTAKDAATEWMSYDLGVFEPKGKPYVWFSGCKNAEAVPEILIDRVYFVEEAKR